MIERVAQARQWPEQALGHEDQHAVRAHVELAVDHHEAAKKHDGDEAGDDHHANDRYKAGTDLDCILIALAILIAGLAHAGQFILFSREALDGGDAAEIVGQLAVEHANLLAHARIARLQQTLEAQRAPDDQRHGQDGQPADLRRDDQKHGPDDGDRGDQLNDVVGAFVQKALELVDVIVEHRHQPARAAIFEVGHLHVLHVIVGVQTQVMLHGLGQIAPQDAVEVLEERLQAPRPAPSARRGP